MATRNERVVLTLQDDFTGPMARAAAATRLLANELDRLDGRTKLVHKSVQQASGPQGVIGLGKGAERAGNQIDRLSGRLKIALDLVSAFGPALVPLGGVGIAGLGGLANQLGVAAVAGGSAIVAFQGVGEALDAMGKARLEPTTENLAKAREELSQLAPAAQEFVTELYGMRDAWAGVQQASANALFPGLTEALGSLNTRLPEVERILVRINQMTGSLAADAAESLAGPEWDDFFDFLATDAVDTLDMLGRTVGALGRGFAELWMAFDPLSDGFSQWALDSARDFSTWADALSETDGFQEFVDYIQTTGPQVAETLGSFGNALVQITQAAAPLGGPALQALEAIADVVSTIADSPVGTPLLTALSAMSALSLATRSYGTLSKTAFGAAAVANIKGTATALTTVTTAQQRATASAQQLATTQANGRRQMLLTGGALAGIGLAASGAADGILQTNAANFALVGALAGPWGAAVGGAIGTIQDFRESARGMEDAIRGANAAIDSGSIEAMRASLAAVNAELDDINSTNFDKGPFGIPTQAGVVGDVLSDAWNKLTGDVDKGKEARDRLNAAIGEAIGAVARESAALSGNTRTIEENIAAIRTRRDEKLRALSAETSYYSAILDAKDALKENGATLNRNTREGLANRSALERLVGSWNELSETARATPGAYASARRALIDMAMQFGMTRREAREYANQLQQVPDKVNTRIQLDTAAAKAGLESFIRTASGRTISIGTRIVARSDQAIARADGGTIPGPRYPYGDKVLMLGAPGEEVITNRNGEADRFRADRAAGRIPAYADGGTVNAWAGYVPAFANGGTVTNGNDGGSRNALARLRRELDATSEALRTERDERRALAEAIRSNYKSDLFAAPSDVFSAGAGDFMSLLTGDIADLRDLNKARRTLTKKGLDGSALADLLANGDLATVQGVAGMSRAEIRRFEQLYDRREALAGRVAGQAAGGVFRQDIRALERELKQIKAELKRKGKQDTRERKEQARDVGREINGTVRTGARNRKRGG